MGNYPIGGSGDYAAKVNGQTIERAQLEQAFQSERSRMQQQLGDQFSALAGNEGYMQQMRRQVLSQLIDNMLLDQYAKKLGGGQRRSDQGRYPQGALLPDQRPVR